MTRILKVLVLSVAFVMFTEASAFAKELMFLPFGYGTRVKCVQGNNGSYSHTGKMKYAYDFVLSSGNIYGTNLYSPVTGKVIDSRQGAPDYQYNNESSSKNNYGWGNTLLLLDYATYKYVRIAHMKNGSCSLKKGDHVELGQKIGRVGNSGYSSEAHLHIHMQDSSSNTAYSESFDFIEGDVQQGKKYYSELETNVFVLDAGGAVSMANEVSSFSTSKSSGWDTDSTSSSNKMTAGDSYVIECDEGKNQWFKWKFKMDDTGVYALYVRADSGGSKDKYALYYIYSSDDDDVSEEIEVNQDKSTDDQLKYLTTVTLHDGATYYIKLFPTTDGRDVTADSLHFYRLY